VPLWTLWQHGSAPDDDQIAEPHVAHAAEPVRSVAVISAEADAVWKNAGDRKIGKGTTLEPGRLLLIRGLAQVDFFSGASITLSGPAEIKLRSSRLVILHHGRVRADVPPAARGFEIQTAGERLADLGTSFGVSAKTNGNAEAVVFAGETRTMERSGKSVSLFAGDAAVCFVVMSSISRRRCLESMFSCVIFEK